MIVKPKIVILILIMIVLVLANLSMSYGQQTINEIQSFKHQISINEYGFTLINETITIQNNFDIPTSLPNIEISYPDVYFNLITSYSLIPDEIALTIEKTENATKFILFNEGFQIAPNENIIISLKIYLSKLIFQQNELTYNAIVSFMPKINIPTIEVESSFLLPQQTTFLNPLIGYTPNEINGREIWTSTSSDVNQVPIIWNVSLKTRLETDISLLEFLETKREIFISSQGIFNIKETISFLNYGDNSLSNLKLNLLNNNIDTVKLIPPLVNPKNTQIANGIINLETTINKDERYTFGIEYPLPSQFIDTHDSTLELSIPLKPSILGVSNKITIKSDFQDGFFINHNGKVLSRENVSPLTDEVLKFIVSPGLAWSSGEIIPIASLVFIVILISSLVFQRRILTPETKKAKTQFELFIEVLEENISSSKELIKVYEKRDRDKISRKNFTEISEVIEGRKSKSSSKMNELRTSIIALQPSLKGSVNEVFNKIRELDKTVKDLINLFTMHQNRRIKHGTFERLYAAHQKRFGALTNNLLDILETLKDQAG
jgi:hypothetical protein